MGRKQEAAVDEYGFKKNYVDIWGDNSRERRDERTLITAGNWVMIIKSLPVSDAVAPQLYGIYWAVPFVREGWAAIKDKPGATGTAKEETEIACYKRAIEILISYGGKGDHAKYEQKAEQRAG